VIRERGRAAAIVSLSGDLDPALDRNITLHGILVRPDGERLRRIVARLGAGQLRAVVDSVMPWDRAPEAHARLDSGHGFGKTVLVTPRGSLRPLS
jgi:NADPH:quinone reductase